MRNDCDVCCPYCERMLQYEDGCGGETTGYCSDGLDGICPHVVAISGTYCHEGEDVRFPGSADSGTLCSDIRLPVTLDKLKRGHLEEWANDVGDEVPNDLFEFVVNFKELLPDGETITYPGQEPKSEADCTITGFVLFALEPTEFVDALPSNA